jgi:glycosyltransferase EpsJ
MSNPEVSVIIPLYNVEDYLSECLDSVVNQSLQNIEIILIDDGSPDKSGEIADEYAERDSRIKVFHQSNRGVGHARNAGIESARGEFVYIMDSDDWLEPAALQRMYDAAVEHNIDSVLAAHWIVDNNGNRQKCHSGNRSYDGELRFIGGPAWCRLIRRKILVDNKEIRFPENIWTSEDTIFALLLDFFTDRIIRLDETLIFYRQHPASKLHSLKERNSEVKNAVAATLSFWNSFIERHPEFLERYSCELAFIVSIPLVFYSYPFSFGIKTIWHFRKLFCKIDFHMRNKKRHWIPFAWIFWRYGVFFPPLGIRKFFGVIK